MPKNERLRQHRIQCNWRQQDVADQLGISLITMQRWERGYQQPSAYYRIKLCALFGKSAQELGLVEALPPLPSSSELENESRDSGHRDNSPSQQNVIWTIPYVRNPHFTGRDDLLSHLMEQFSPQETNLSTNICQVTLTQTQAIKGLGGIGKTQIAIEYAYRAHEQRRYTHTIWINAASEETILTSFITLADVIPTFVRGNEIDQRKLVTAIIHWLEQCPDPWLLIVDNADDLSFIPSYLPSRGNGNILLTTRANAVGALISSTSAIEVDCMSLMEGAYLLLRRAQREGSATISEIDEATNIAVTLAQFPLALDQAGAYIEETNCSLHDYFQLYQQHRYALLARRGKQASHYPKSVATTWSLSFQHVEQSNPAAAELLRLCTFLASDHIPEELLTEGAPHWPLTLQQAVTDPFTFNQMLECLLAFSLVKRLPKSRQFSIHRLVQMVQKEQLTSEEQRQWAERLVRALHLVFPRNLKEVNTWSLCQRYLDQVQACDLLIQEHHLLFPEAAELLDRAGTYLRECALHSLAEPLYQRALFLRESQMGADHPATALSLNNLAMLFYKQGQPAQAEAFYHRALHIQEQQLGPEHPDLAAPLTGLASLYSDQNKNTQVELLYHRALHIQEYHLGPEHPDLAETLTGLAFFSFKQGQYVQAESLYQRALHIQEHHLGPEHLDLAVTLTGLAYISSRRGNYGEEEVFYQRALHILEQQLGPEHPNVAPTLIGLANLYRDTGKYTQAEQLYQRALSLEKILGPEHPQLARALLGLALLSFKQGQYVQAERLHQRVLRLLEPLLGADNYHLAYSLTGLADIYQEQGKETQAESLYQRALYIREQQLGPEHPDVATPLHGLARLFSRQGKYWQAKSLYRRALHICEQQLGLTNQETAEVLYDFAGLQRLHGQTQEATVLYLRALKIREHVFGLDSAITIGTREHMYEGLVELEQEREIERNDR